MAAAQENIFINEEDFVGVKHGKTASKQFYAMVSNGLKEEKKYKCVQKGMNSGNDQVQ